MSTDPRRLFDAQDIEAAALYAKRVASDLADLYPVLVKEDGSLLVTITSGTISIDTAGLATSVGQTTHTTLLQEISDAVTGTLTVGSVSLTDTRVTVDNTVPVTGTVSLSNTIVTAHLSPSTTVVTVHISPSGSLATVSLSSTVVTVSNTAGTVTNSVSTLMILNKSLSSSSGTVTATQVTLVLAGSNKTKVYAFSLTTTSTTGVICAFHHGSQSGPELWRVLLQAPSGANSGANLAVSPPAHIFATQSAATLILFLSTAVRVDFSLSWFDEA